MASGTATIRQARPALSRAVALRLGLATASCAAAVALTSWNQSPLSAGARWTELVLCVSAWEISVTGARALLRRASVATDTSLSLAGAVLIASIPASAGMGLVFRLLGEPVAAPLETYGQSLALGLLLAFARRGVAHFGPSASEGGDTATVPVEGPEPHDAARRFLVRHAPKLAGRRLLALEAEDHYLRIHTDGGTALVLMRLRDAVTALGPQAGWQPHRSFWVAAGTASRPVRDGQRWMIELPGGLTIPVSRARMADLRAAGTPTRDGPLTSRPPAPVAPAPRPAPPW